MGVEWDTSFQESNYCADEVGITPIVERAADGAIKIAKNARRAIVGTSPFATT
jgi:hypothetical protein